MIRATEHESTRIRVDISQEAGIKQDYPKRCHGDGSPDNISAKKVVKRTVPVTTENRPHDTVFFVLTTVGEAYTMM